jgi:hypothetical protein
MTLSNNGTVNLLVNSIRIDGDPGFDFSMQSGFTSSGFTLQPGQQCQVFVSFTTSGPTTGLMNATLSIAYSPADGPLNVPLEASVKLKPKPGGKD